MTPRRFRRVASAATALGILITMQRSQRCLASTIVAILLLSPGIAVAQSDAVTFDDGPSSKEYAIPLDAARGATKTKAPTPKAQATTAAAPPAVVPPTATTPPSASKAKAKAKATSKTKTTTTQAVAPVTTPPQPPSTAATPVSAPASSNGTGAGFVIGGLALAAIALGGLAGLLLRRRRQPVDEY